MRHFTREFSEGDLGGGEAEDRARRAAYEARLAAIEADLPSDLLRLARDVRLHDGLIEFVRWSPAERELVVGLVVGDESSGYSAVRLAYGGVLLGAPRKESLRRAATSRETSILFDEVDVDDVEGHFVHRILFWPSEQVTLEFDALTLATEPRPDRRVQLSAAFEERSGDDDHA